MRLLILLIGAILAGAPARAQGTDTPPQPEASSTDKDRQAGSSGSANDAQPSLPVSLDRIREALERPAPVQHLKGLDEKPDFSVEIRERQKIDELLATLDFKSGPTPSAGLYGLEQQRLAFPSVDNPLMQPYAAFSQGQLLTILVENLAGKYLAGRALNAITGALRAEAEAEARRDVEAAVAQYCAGQPPPSAAQLCLENPGR